MFRLFAPSRSFLLAALVVVIVIGAPARADAVSLTAVTRSAHEVSSLEGRSLLMLWQWIAASPFDVELPIGIGGVVSDAVTRIAAAAREPRLVAFPIAGHHEESSPFGYRQHPLTKRRRLHTGMDFSAKPGTPVVAAASGVVSFARRTGGYGRLVVVDHGNGFETRYAHLRRIRIEEGQAIAAGQRIGAVGSSGWATGPHLHFEVRANGEAVDPAPLLGAIDEAEK